MAPRQPVLKRQKPRGWELETYLMEESRELQTILKVDSNNTSNLCLFQTTQHQRYINTDGLDPSCSGIVARSQKVNRFSRSSPESRDRRKDRTWSSTLRTNEPGRACAHLSLPCRHLPSSSDRCSFFLPPATPRNSRFGLTMRPLSPALASTSPQTQLPINSRSRSTSCFTHTLRHSGDLSFPFPSQAPFLI